MERRVSLTWKEETDTHTFLESLTQFIIESITTVECSSLMISSKKSKLRRRIEKDGREDSRKKGREA